MKISRLACVWLLVSIAGACQQLLAEPEGNPDTSGIVREIHEFPVSPNTVGRFLVEHPGVSHPADKSTVHVSAETAILVRDAAGQLRPGQFGDIQVGASTRIWTTGVELRSYPRQVFATRIEVLR